MTPPEAFLCLVQRQLLFFDGTNAQDVADSIARAASDYLDDQADQLAREVQASRLPVNPRLICKTCGTTFTGYHDCGGLI